MDGRVAAMSLQERGAYITLLCLCWQEGSLPADPVRLARMVGLTPRAWTRIADAVCACFQEADGRLTQPRLEREREKQRAYRDQQRAKGRASGVTRSNHGSTAVQPNVNQIATAVQPNTNRGSTEPPTETQLSDLRSPISDVRTPPTPPRGEIAQGFARFWAVYPRKVGKAAAFRWWTRHPPDEALIETMLAAIQAQQQTAQWQDAGGQFIPHPATWLRGERWLDDVRGVPTMVPLHGAARERAIELRRKLGGCRHDPPCEDYEGCLTRLDGAGIRRAS